jgi:hypothetical protein
MNSTAIWTEDYEVFPHDLVQIADFFQPLRTRAVCANFKSLYLYMGRFVDKSACEHYRGFITISTRFQKRFYWIKGSAPMKFDHSIQEFGLLFQPTLERPARNMRPSAAPVFTPSGSRLTGKNLRETQAKAADEFVR